MRNIYEMRNYKLLILLPLALLFIALYFIPHITLDSSLAGGVSVTLTTSSSVSVQNLTSQLSAKVPNTQVSESSVSGVTSILVTMPANASLASADNEVLAVYSQYANYTAAAVSAQVLLTELAAPPDTATARSLLSDAPANQPRALASMNSHLSAEFTYLAPFISRSQIPYNASSAQSVRTASQSAYTNASAVHKARIIGLLGSYVHFSNYSYQDVTPTLGSFFLRQVRDIIITAFILVAIAVFFIFRTPIPSMAVVFGAANDIIVALGAMGAFHIPLGIASVGGILMLIGFSIDTDLLSSIRILKRTEGTPTERAMSTFNTGITMTSTAIISFLTLFVISYIAFIPTYIEISGVVLFGLLADILTTWFGNTVMVVWYKKRKDVI